ncbi:MAG: hypothetical protein V5A43_02885 [Haloarculaceae archaeon]
MDSEGGGDIEGEVTRVEAVTYLEGAVGHAVGSLLFAAVGIYIWFTGDPAFAALVIAIGFLLSGNGLSLWAWSRLQTYVASQRATPEPDEVTRSLKVDPISQNSLLTVKTGAVIVPSLAGFLLLALGAVYLLGVALASYLFVAILLLGNVTAIANAVRG